VGIGEAGGLVGGEVAGQPGPGNQDDRPLPWLRLVLAVSLDGRLAPPEGGAAQLGGSGDRRVLEESLAWADAVLVGAQTIRLHGSTCLIHEPDLLESRSRRQISPQPLVLVVSRSARFPQSLPFFRQPLRRWLLRGLWESPLSGVEGFERLLPAGDWRSVLAELGALGLERIVLLGGARLAASLLGEDLVNELQLTICPRLLGGGHTWLPHDCALPADRHWQLLEQRDLGDGELLLRYRRCAYGRAGPAAG
jgi:5-amino-6-(5-phosphoribosylamino)uracil reductase